MPSGGEIVYVPGLKERVCQRGLPGLFLVVWVDRDRQTADLIRLDTECAWLEEGVPFEELQPWQEARGFVASESLPPLSVKRATY
jgi:hypothetical protein